MQYGVVFTSTAHLLRSPHGRQTVPEPFLSPNAAPFYPRDAPPLQDQESDVSMPDWDSQVGAQNTAAQAPAGDTCVHHTLTYLVIVAATLACSGQKSLSTQLVDCFIECAPLLVRSHVGLKCVLPAL